MGDSNNMASREMLSKILKNTLQTSLRGQQHPVKKLLSKNSPCIANVVYRNFPVRLSAKVPQKDLLNSEHPKKLKNTLKKNVNRDGADLDFGHMTNFVTKSLDILP